MLDQITYSTTCNNDFVGVVVSSTRDVLEPQVTFQKIVALAQERTLNKKRHFSFSTASLESGYRFYGGKTKRLFTLSWFSLYKDPLKKEKKYSVLFCHM